MTFIEGAIPTDVKSGVIETLIDYKNLSSKFKNPPKVDLRIVPKVLDTEEDVSVRDIAITTAVQCYAPGDAKLKPRLDEKSQGIADSTIDAGHHTTRMHTHYTFHLKISRDLAERVFHFTPFYNSEQQSQRFVEAKSGNYEIPEGLTAEQEKIYIEAAEYMNHSYFELLDSLRPDVEGRVKEMYPKGGWQVPKTAERLNIKIDKICQEVSRYVLPIAQRTVMYHTISELQLLRLFRASKLENFTDEAKYVIATMIEEVARIDSSILLELDKPINPPIHPRFEESTVVDQKREFDEMLGNKSSMLISSTENPEFVLAMAVRNVLGVSENSMSNSQALNFLMDPHSNTLLADVYETGMFDPLTSCLRQVSITCMSKISHTAESQRQRHRRTPGATATVERQYTSNDPDYITPLVIRENKELKDKYDGMMKNIYANVKKCLDSGISKENALKLLPNAHAVRIVESGDLFDWLHRFKQRLCYLAQEEICFMSIEQVEQLSEILPQAGRMLLAPCGVAVNAGTGRCPEGDRWCGQKVWNWKIDQYKKGRII